MSLFLIVFGLVAIWLAEATSSPTTNGSASNQITPGPPVVTNMNQNSASQDERQNSFGPDNEALERAGGKVYEMGSYPNGRRCKDGNYGLTGRETDVVNEHLRKLGLTWSRRGQVELDGRAKLLHYNCKSNQCVGYFYKGNQLLCHSTTVQPIHILIGVLLGISVLCDFRNWLGQ